jgi:hypothetical protein
MRTHQAFVQIILGAALLVAATAQAADQPNPASDRVVITGKSLKVEPVQLPRVVLTGLSVNSQMQQLMLASAKPAVRRI